MWVPKKCSSSLYKTTAESILAKAEAFSSVDVLSQLFINNSPADEQKAEDTSQASADYLEPICVRKGTFSSILKLSAQKLYWYSLEHRRVLFRAVYLMLGYISVGRTN